MSELEKEQPAPEEKNATSRRDFIKLAGALAGAAGVTKLFMGTPCIRLIYVQLVCHG